MEVPSKLPPHGKISERTLKTEEADCETLNVVSVPTDQPEDDEEEDEDDHILKLDTDIDHFGLCKAEIAHDSVLGKLDASLAKKPLIITEAPHLDTKALIAKLDEVAKNVDLNVSTILAEQIKGPVLGTVRSWIRKQISPDVKSPEIQQSKGLLRYCQELDRLLIETEGQLLCYDEPSDELDEENHRICLHLSLFLACFRQGRYIEMGGHMGATKSFANAERFFYWPWMFHWICALTADFITCQNNKPKPKHRNEVHLEEWLNDTIPFRTVHIDHKGPLPPLLFIVFTPALISNFFSYIIFKPNQLLTFKSCGRMPTLNPSTSHIITAPIPPSQPPTPVERLIHHNTRKYQHKEPKYERSQPDHPDPESVLRTRTRQCYELWSLVFF